MKIVFDCAKLIGPMEHRTRNLGGDSHCNVLLCTCGMLHVTIGPVTVRLKPGAAEQLRDVLTDALQQIDAERRPQLRLAPRGDDLPS